MTPAGSRPSPTGAPARGSWRSPGASTAIRCARGSTASTSRTSCSSNAASTGSTSTRSTGEGAAFPGGGTHDYEGDEELVCTRGQGSLRRASEGEPHQGSADPDPTGRGDRRAGADREMAESGAGGAAQARGAVAGRLAVGRDSRASAPGSLSDGRGPTRCGAPRQAGAA